jgi:deazaflavin-dependent oxidoreductase (nitroreductase family)
VSTEALLRRARVHANHAHAWLYARSDGRLGARVGGRDVLLLQTTGRRSGRRRRTPVQYDRIDGDLVVVASAAGASRPPAWWHNLEADPAVEVQVGPQRAPARAVTVRGEERARLWSELCARDHRLEALQRRAGRELPLVRLIVAAV